MAVAAPHASPSTAAAQIASPRVRERAPWALLVALMGCAFYAAFANGGTRLPAESWLQLGIVGVAVVACAAWLYGGGLTLRASPVAWAGVALLAAFAVWTGVTIAWSVAPDRSWVELNRGIAYVLVLVLAIAVGSSLPRAPERVAKALAITIAPIALYAVGGKTVPGFHIGGLIDLDQAGGVTRLRSPLEYWNALALVCVFGLPPTLRLAADPARRPRARLLALFGVYLLVIVIGLTYSRGGILALLLALGVFLALATQRVRSIALFLGAGFMATFPLTFALASPDLTTNALPLERREDDALRVLIVLLVAGAALLAWGWFVMRTERGRRFTPALGRWVGRRVAIAGAVVLALGFVSAAANGALGRAADQFTDTKGGAGLTDPNRLLSTSSGNRWTWWQEAAGAWADKPLAGWGAGSFPVTHKLYRTVLLPVQHPHSVPLQFLAETGVVGAILGLGGLLALIAAALARARELPWRLEGDSPRAYAAALLAAPVAWFGHSFYDWDWDIPGVTVAMLVVLGVLVARPARTLPAAGSPGLRALTLGAVVAGLLLFALSAVLPALAKTRTAGALAKVGEAKVTEEQLADAASDAELASSLNPLSVEPLLAAAAIAERRGRLAEARAAILRALDRQPYSTDAWFQLTRIELVRLDRASIRRAAARALELDPLNGAAFAVARRSQQASVLPGESATATGSPLPTQVPITQALPPAASGPAVTATPFPSITPIPGTG